MGDGLKEHMARELQLAMAAGRRTQDPVSLEQLAVLARETSAMPRPVSYIVLDPMHMGPATDDVDGVGRRYLVVSPGILGEMKFVKQEEAPQPTRLFGVPVYRLEDMRADWPGYGVDHVREG